jgi:hypothetical protein
VYYRGHDGYLDMTKKSMPARECLEEYLDAHPCKQCGGHYNDHSYLTAEEIDEALDQNCAVRTCEAFPNRNGPGSGVTYFVVVYPLPDDPCDSAFMEEISS